MRPDLGTDIRWGADLATDAAGDCAVVSGADCLVQDLRLRLRTPKDTLMGHPGYGFDWHSYLHLEATSTHQAALVADIEEQVQADPRVVQGSVSAEVLRFTSDGLSVRVRGRAVGVEQPFSLVIGYGIEQAPEVINGL